jgi:hypothetical protein
VREYEQDWLAIYEANTTGDITADCTGATPTEDGYALPIDRALIAARPAMP